MHRSDCDGCESPAGAGHSASWSNVGAMPARTDTPKARLTVITSASPIATTSLLFEHSTAAGLARSMLGCWIDPELSQNRQIVPVGNVVNDLAIHNTQQSDPLVGHRFACCRNA